MQCRTGGVVLCIPHFVIEAIRLVGGQNTAMMCRPPPGRRVIYATCSRCVRSRYYGVYYVKDMCRTECIVGLSIKLTF